ncbi:MAG: AAA family ATPase [Halococcoides sp.]
MTVIGFVGLPGSGKSEAAAVAREAGLPVVAMGDVIRAACRERGRDPATDHGAVARALREEEGATAIAERTVPHLRDALDRRDAAVVEGIRSNVEVERFRETFGASFVLVRIDAPREVRAERLADRGRDADADAGGETLADRDAREKSFGMDAAMAMADHAIANTDDLATFRERVRDLLQEVDP